MAKYHLNSNGDIAICKATKVNCPFGGADSHFDAATPAEASIMYMQKLSKEYENSFSKISKNLTPWEQKGWEDKTDLEKFAVLYDVLELIQNNKELSEIENKVNGEYLKYRDNVRSLLRNSAEKDAQQFTISDI